MSDARVLPGKYRYLQQAGQAGLTIPAGILLAEPLDVASLHELLAPLLVSGGRFMVRSAVAAEDGDQQSLAGHFWSSPAVDAADLPATVLRAWAENSRILTMLGLSAHPAVMVQAYIEHQIGGVLFTPWGFFDRYALLDVSEAGAQAAVAGDAVTAVISLAEDGVAPLALPTTLAWLEPNLQVMAQRLRQVFAFPLDVEWAYCQQSNALVVLQVRPQTRMVGAVQALPAPLRQVGLPPGQWAYTALSESLGQLSPLSFSVLQQLYVDSIPALRHLGCKAQQVDFLLHLPDGTVLVDTMREQAFFRLSVLGGFWRGMRAGSWQQACRVFVAQWQADTPFSSAVLASLFGYWLVDTLLRLGEERNLIPPSHEYELTWNAPVCPAGSTVRQAFFGEWGKLKQQVAAQVGAGVAFCTWDEYQRGETASALARQAALAALAVYDHSSLAVSAVEGTGMRSLAARKVVTGTALVVQQPNRFRGEFPAGCILVTPFFDNHWVAQLARCAGVVVMQGGLLSHSALVARELAIPYCVVDAGLVADIQTGERITLDPLQQVIQKVT
ncbi:MAG: hypothetical protein JG718_07735 [Candidatus Thiothrix moscowensis]|nr:hypothetical protein [Candidatus Thiothrix moscowensis]